MSLFMVIQEAKVYHSFYVYAKNAFEAKELVDHGGDLTPYATYVMNGDQEVVEIWQRYQSGSKTIQDMSFNLSRQLHEAYGVR